MKTTHEVSGSVACHPVPLADNTFIHSHGVKITKNPNAIVNLTPDRKPQITQSTRKFFERLVDIVCQMHVHDLTLQLPLFL